MPRWSRIFSRTPWTKPITPRLPRMYRGVRGLLVGFSLATTTGSPTLNLLFIDSLGSGGALRQDEVPNVGSAVVHSDLFTGGNLQLKHFLRAGAGILHDLRPVALVLVPPWRVAQDVVRI